MLKAFKVQRETFCGTGEKDRLSYPPLKFGFPLLWGCFNCKWIISVVPKSSKLSPFPAHFYMLPSVHLQHSGWKWIPLSQKTLLYASQQPIQRMSRYKANPAGKWEGKGANPTSAFSEMNRFVLLGLYKDLSSVLINRDICPAYLHITSLQFH